MMREPDFSYIELNNEPDDLDDMINGMIDELEDQDKRLSTVLSLMKVQSSNLVTLSDLLVNALGRIKALEKGK